MRPRTCAIVYVVVILVVAFFIRDRDKTKRLTALRFLGANTRLSEKLLVKPNQLSIEESYALDRELKSLDGKYIKKDVAAREPVTAENVSDWPAIKPSEAFPVELQNAPDWVFLNQGSLVQVWVANKPTPERAQVLAILPAAGDKWLALLRRRDVSALLAGAKDSHVVRLEVMAGEVEATPMSSPTPAPSPMLSLTETPKPSPSPQPTKNH